MDIKNQMRAVNLRFARLAGLAVVGAIALAGCSGGAGTTPNPVPDRPDAGANYNGPPAATADIQAFAVEFWTPVRQQAGCDTCHNAGGQSPQFVRADDVNAAYQQASGIVNRDNPSL